MKKVVKFGGSNLRDIKSIESVIKVFELYGNDAVFVVSALYGTTDYLKQVYLNSLQSEALILEAIATLKEKHTSILSELVSINSILAKGVQEIEFVLSGLQSALLGIHYLGRLSDDTHDLILSFGEKLSAVMLRAILISRGWNAIVKLPEDMGLLTNGKYGRASVKINESRERVANSLKHNGIVIVPGFYGINVEGSPTLLGRGGSDYTAAALANIINADALDLWKDVDGFRSADPGLVSNSEVIEILSYTEAAELSYFGAKILHPGTIEPLEALNIPVRIFNILTAEQKFAPSTIICKDGLECVNIIKSVTYSNDFGLVKIKGASVGFVPGIISKVASALDSGGLNIKSIITSQTSINFLLDSHDISLALQLVSEIGELEAGTVTADDSISVVAIVGQGIVGKYGIAGRALNALSSKKINVSMLALGASEVSAYLVVNNSDCKRAVCLIHDEFYNKN